MIVCADWWFKGSGFEFSIIMLFVSCCLFRAIIFDTDDPDRKLSKRNEAAICSKKIKSQVKTFHFVRSSESIYRHLIAFKSYRIHTESIKFGIIWLFTKLKCGERWTVNDERWTVNGELNGADIWMIVCALGIFLHLYIFPTNKKSERCQQQRPFYQRLWISVCMSVFESIAKVFIYFVCNSNVANARTNHEMKKKKKWECKRIEKSEGP